MLLHKNGRFYINGLSFALPDNICILTKETPYCNYNGFVFGSMDQNIQVLIDTEDAMEPPEEYFKSNCFTKNTNVLSEVKKIENDGVEGVYIFCETKSEQYCEMRFKLPYPSDEATILTVCVLVQNGVMPIKAAMKSPHVTDFISSIRKDAF